MTDIFDEVEESLREERYRTLFRRYAPLGALMIIAVILGVAGREAWTSMRANAAARSSDAFLAAQTELEAGRLDAAMASFAELGESGSRGYAAMAKMQQAAAAAAAGSNAEAAALYEEGAELTNDSLLADMARLKAAYLLADTINAGALRARLEPLMERGGPYAHAARELAGAAALAAGDFDRAREAYTFLSVALEAPPSMQQRAAEALAVIDAAEAAAAVPDTPAASAASEDDEEG